MPNPNRPARSPSIPIPAPSRRNIEDILNISNLTPPPAGVGFGGASSGPSTSPQRERNQQQGRWTPSMNPRTRLGSFASPSRGADGGSSGAAPSGASSPGGGAVGRTGAIGSWNGAQSAASWTPRSVSSSVVQTSSRPISQFEPRVIRPDSARAGDQDGGHAGIAASRPLTQRRDSNAGGASASPSRARRASTTTLAAASVGGSAPRSPAVSHLHTHTPPVLQAKTISSSTTSAPPSVPFLRPRYIEYSALRDIIHTDASATAALNQTLAHGHTLGRAVLLNSVPPRRDFSPLSDSDEDSDNYGASSRILRTSRDRGRPRDPAAGYHASSISQAIFSEPILRLPTRWSDQDRNKFLSVSDDGRSLQFHGLLNCYAHLLTRSKINLTFG